MMSIVLARPLQVTMGMADSIAEQAAAKKREEHDQVTMHAGANEHELRELLAQVRHPRK